VLSQLGLATRGPFPPADPQPPHVPAEARLRSRCDRWREGGRPRRRRGNGGQPPGGWATTWARSRLGVGARNSAHLMRPADIHGAVRQACLVFERC
jgi:hypothetical protein